MENLILIYILPLLGGILIHILLKLRKLKTVKDFNFKVWIKDNIINFSLTLICGFFFLYLYNEIEFYTKFELTSLMCFIAGYLSDSILRHFVKIINSKSKMILK